MSFYRKLIVAVAAMGLASAVFADDTTTTTTTPADTTATTTDTTAATSDNSTTTTTTTTTADATNTATENKIDLNKATAKELMKVKGLNAAKAKAIVTYRTKHGEFKSVEDLKEVKGFKTSMKKPYKISKTN